MSPKLRSRIATEIRRELDVKLPRVHMGSQYRDFGRMLADRIESQRHGGELPTIGEAAEELGVPVLTVQRWHGKLAQMGIVERYAKGGPIQISDELVLRAAGLGLRTAEPGA